LRALWGLFEYRISVATLVATGYLFVVISKGFFPQQDTGLIIGTPVVFLYLDRLNAWLTGAARRPTAIRETSMACRSFEAIGD
jgi:hypothetical protein